MSKGLSEQNEMQAALWLARMDGGGWDDAEEAELQQWLAEDLARAGALLQAQAAWMTLDKLGAQVAPSVAEARAEPIFTRRRMLIGGSAALAASLAGGFLLVRGPTSYATDIGEIRRVPLADGSTAAINTGSVVEITLADARREVRIEKGEAWFQVAKDPKRPFIVEAGRVRVQAVGTAFSVRRRDGGADILVTEGVVETWAEGAEGHRVRLAAGARAFVSDNAAISKAPPVASSVDRALAWRAGKIDLVGEPLAEAVAEFNRYNRRRIVIADPEIAHEQLDGIFRTDDPEGFAIVIKSTLGVPVDMSNPSEIRVGRTRGS